MMKENLMKVLFVFFFGKAVAQNNFSVYSTFTAQPTENININNIVLGSNYAKEFNSKYKLEADVVYDSKNITYFDGNSFNSILNNFVELKSVFAFSYFKNSKYKYHFRVEPFIASQNQLELSSIYVFSQFAIDFTLKQNNILTIGFGNSSVFGKPSLIPIISYYYKYNDKLDFSIGFPKTVINYSNNSRNIFALKNDFNGSFYELDSDSKSLLNPSTKASFSQMTSYLEYERNMDANWFINFKAGYDFNKKYLLLDNNYNTTFDFNIEDGFNLGITIKYKH